MRRFMLSTVIGAAAALASATPSYAAPTLIGVFSGNQCGGAGGFAACYALGTTAGNGSISKSSTSGGSPSIIRIGNGDGDPSDTGSFASISGNELVISFNANTHILTYTYTRGANDPVARYLGLFQGGNGVGAADGVKNPYLLFYDPNGFTTGTIDIGAYYANSNGWSHVDLFDSAGAVPEPATWAMMLLGFGGIGTAMRRRRRQSADRFMQIA